MYLKWLVQADGNRVPVREAIGVFGTLKHDAATLKKILDRER